MEASILIVDDDLQMGELLSAKLSSEGFDVAHARDGARGIAMVQEWQPDLVILDALMPGMDGWEACREIRRISRVPVIFLSCVTGEKEKVRGLNLGADDYIGKPFSSSELLARIRAVLRRSELTAAGGDGSLYVDGDLTIDLARREAESGGGAAALTLIEARILDCLIGYVGQVVPQERLIRRVWGGDAEGSRDESLRQHIRHLRQKLEPDPRHPQRLVTRRGNGYQLRRLVPEG
ncbi:MAG TPA: response regulator transcription factor [Anaerolineae bacterium]|nr:response regulator transcription factor [Anaerolineae bacterium]